jgi:hypothetical protein
MPVRIVRLGSPRSEGEGLRIGTVRRPPEVYRRDATAPSTSSSSRGACWNPGRLLNRESYDAIADFGCRAPGAHGREQVFLEAFLEGLSVPSEILDLGCAWAGPWPNTCWPAVMP